MFWLYLLVLTILCRGAKADFGEYFNVWAKSIDKEDVIAECLSTALRTRIRTYKPTARVSVEAKSKLVRWELAETMGKFLALSEGLVADLGTSEQFIHSIHFQIYFIDSIEAFTFLIDRKKNEQTIANSRYDNHMVILPASSADRFKTMREILRFASRRGIVNVCIIMADREPRSVTFYTYDPFTPANCHKSVPVVQVRYANGSFVTPFPVFFPRKSGNLWQCPLKVALWQRPPFIELERRTPGGDIQSISGLDGCILRFLADAFNFSIQVIVPAGGRGTIYANGSASGAFEMLKNREVDIVMGFTQCSAPRRKILSATNAYMISNLKLIVKRPASYRPLQILLLPFGPYTWTTIFVLHVGRFFAKILWRAMSLPQTDSFKRLLRISWLLCSIVLYSCYGGSVFKFMQNRPSNLVPCDIEEALRAGYKLFTTNLSRNVLDDNPILRDNVVMLNVSESVILDESLKYDDQPAVLVLEELITFHNNNPAKYEEFIVARENVMTQFACMYFQRFSFLTYDFDEYLKLMIRHGLVNKIYKDFVQTENFKNQVDANRQVKRVRGVAKKLNFEVTCGPFKMLAYTLCTTGWVFLAELRANRNRFVGRIMDALH